MVLVFLTITKAHINCVDCCIMQKNHLGMSIMYCYYYYYLLTQAFQVVSSSATNHHCYVSESLKYFDSAAYLYNYPNIYFHNGDIPSSEDHLNCNQRVDTFRRPRAIDEMYNCTLKPFCPLNPHTISTALYPQQWIAQYEGFSKLLVGKITTHTGDVGRDNDEDKTTASGNKPVVNVVIIGGSFTAGDQIQCGCYCIGRVDSRCTNNTIGTIQESYDQSTCTWHW